jgi:hypothetical protein
MEEAIEKIEAWRIDYNVSRPHQALQESTPDEFAKRTKELEGSRGLQTAENQLSGWSGKPKRLTRAVRSAFERSENPQAGH